MERLKPQLVGSLSCLVLFQFVFCLLLFIFCSLYFVFMRRMKRQFVGVLLPSCQPFLATYTILTGQLTSYHSLVIVAMVFIMLMGMRHKYFFLFLRRCQYKRYSFPDHLDHSLWMQKVWLLFCIFLNLVLFSEDELLWLRGTSAPHSVLKLLFYWFPLEAALPNSPLLHIVVK